MATDRRAGTCPHCGDALRDHKVQRPVYDNRAVFACACGCRINGSVEPIRREES